MLIAIQIKKLRIVAKITNY